MRVVVNLDLCEGNALCMGAVPEVFDVDDERDKAIVLDGQPPEELRPRLMEAVRSCPRQAISLVDRSGAEGIGGAR